MHMKRCALRGHPQKILGDSPIFW